MCVCVDGEAMMRCFKKKFSLLLSIYMYNVCTYIPKNDQDGNLRDNYPEGGGG